MHKILHSPYSTHKFDTFLACKKSSKIFYRAQNFNFWKNLLGGGFPITNFQSAAWFEWTVYIGQALSPHQASNKHSTSFHFHIQNQNYKTGVQKWHEFLISTNSDIKNLSYGPSPMPDEIHLPVKFLLSWWRSMHMRKMFGKTHSTQKKFNDFLARLENRWKLLLLRKFSYPWVS
jgi:hypothetical protein